MAVTYLMFPLADKWVGMDTNVPVTTSGGTKTQTGTIDFTIPNLAVGNYTGTWLYNQIQRTAYEATHCSFSSSGSTRVEYTNYNTSYSSDTYYAFTSPGKGNAITVRMRTYAYNINAQSNMSYANVKVQYKFSSIICIGVTLPTISQVLYASQVNTLAIILNVTGPTQGNAITRTPCQNIGTAVNKAYSTWNKKDGSNNSTQQSSVTFDSTKPIKSNIDTCITRLTEKYVYR